MGRFQRFLAVALMITTLLAAAVFAGGQKEKATGKGFTIAVVSKALDNPVDFEVINGSEKAAKELGITVQFTGSSKPDAAEQATVIEGLIEKGVNGILLAANDPDALVGVISKAVSKGIIVACYDSDSPKSKRAFYCGTDNYQLGVACATEMKKITGGKAKVTVMTGVVGAFNLDERIRGFKEGIKGSNIEILSVQACDDNIEKSQEILNTYTPGHPEMDAWLIVGGWPFIAPPEGVPELKKFRERGGKVVIIDTFEPMLKFMKQTPPYADVMIGQDFFAMGEIGVKMIYDIKNGKKVDPTVYTPLEYCTLGNVDKLLATKTPWNKK